MEKEVIIRVPCSTANLGPGFDALGMALPLYSTVTMRQSATNQTIFKGNELKGLDRFADNLIQQSIRRVFDEVGRPSETFELEVDSEIPLTRGLGSSAAAIVGGLVAANVWLEYPLDESQLLDLATQIEGHPDNVAPCLYGGMVAAVVNGNHTHAIKITPPKELWVTVGVPFFQLSTRDARGVLPEQVSRADALFNLSRAGLLVAAFATGKLSFISEAVADRLHQLYRMPLVPGLSEIIKDAKQNGALGAALSGAGPSVIVFSEGEQKQIGEWVERVFTRHGIQSRTHCFQPVLEGARVLASPLKTGVNGR